MSWKQKCLDHAASRGRATYDNELGIGIEYEDGCDVFWILPGEVSSTLPILAQGPADVQRVLAEYDRISRVRERALHAIRHYLASKRIAVERSRSGQWGIVFEGGMSTTLNVGPWLSRVARDTGDILHVVRVAFEHSLVKPPSVKRIERYLHLPGPPEDERSIDQQMQESPEPRSTIRQVLGLMGLCRALENPKNFTSAQRLATAVAPSGRIGQALMRLAEQLPDAEASVDLLHPGRLTLEFTDGDDAFHVDTKSRALAERIKRNGPEAAGDHLAQEYLRLDGARSAVLNAIRRAAAERGWHQQTFGFALFGIDKVRHLGKEQREVMFAPGEPLTLLVRDHVPEQALQRLFPTSNDFAESCVQALQQPIAAPVPELPDGPLMPKGAPPPPMLRELDDGLVAQLDGFASRTLAEFLSDPRNMHRHRDRTYYDAKIDTWARMEDWVRMAEGELNKQWPDPSAVVILLDAGDPRGDKAAREYLAKAQPHHEVSPSEVELAWRYRHELPDMAAKWFTPQQFDEVPFAAERAALGDPVALRYTTVDQPLEEDEDPTPAALKMMPTAKQTHVHEKLLTWARTDHHWSPPLVERLRLAQTMGWRDVAETLAENPFMLPGLLTIERRSDQLDEPGMLLAGEFLLVWSLLSPDTLLARLIATAHTTDLVGLAKEAARRSAVGKPKVQQQLESSASIYAAWLKELQPVMAIAWTRCRAQLP